MIRELDERGRHVVIDGKVPVQLYRPLQVFFCTIDVCQYTE
jgi:hypothetical protein